ncbi:dual specificity phosphatase catalytic domain protein [Stagonosporopsis vannaccii]|nr:dual specificity phosphatase catalytic domain protein [Stagonosporopsis vannaccii]
MEPHSRSLSSQNGTLRLPQALILLLKSALAQPTNDQGAQSLADVSLFDAIRLSVYRLFLLINPFVNRGSFITSAIVGMVKLTALCGSAYWVWDRQSKKGKIAPSINSQHAEDATLDDAVTNDPGLLRKHSSIQSFTVASTNITYPAIRTFYRPHPQESKFPREPSPVPLLVFIHGLGGSIAQFHPILLSLTNLASCLAVDLPGCGLSSFDPHAAKAYTTDALVQLLAVIIEQYRAKDEDQTVILIGHSMGCSLAALLASPTSPHADLISKHIGGLIAICPKADPPTEHQTKLLGRVTSVPAMLFDLYRRWDRRGGINSASVLRMTGPGAEEETKKLQLRFNRQSRTAVWQHMARGMCPNYMSSPPAGGLPGRQTWKGLQIPVFLLAGEADSVTPADNVKRIVDFLGRDVGAIEPPSEKASLPIAAAPFDPAVIDPALAERKHQDSGIDANDIPKLDDETKAFSTSATSTIGDSLIETETRTSEGSVVIANPPDSPAPAPTSNSPWPHPRRLIVKTTIMPKPAAHSMLFAPSTSRILSGLIGSFLADHIDPRLSLAWQLQYLSTEGKWDVKNLQKWQAVQPVSDPIANTFRAMKTLREVDEHHAPKIVAQEWKNKICAVIDISHDNPVYDPKGLEEGGISYFKFPTVSKQPPLRDEVRTFIELVDRVKSECQQQRKQGLIAVHCHYGFNRTGFFLVCYMVEKLGFRLEDAIEAFRKARPPGIRHSHFIDELHVRYCSGLRRAPTL